MTILFLKATQLKTITVPAYVKRDGTVVPTHTQQVHYNPDIEVHDVVSGKGSHSQKVAHKKLMAKPGFKDLPVEHQFAHILSHATDIQKEASNSAALSLWTTAYAEGKTPSAAQQLVFADLPLDKKLAQIEKAKNKGAKDYVVLSLTTDAILKDAFGDDPVPANINLWLTSVLAGVAPSVDQKNDLAHFMLDHGSIGAKVINAASAIVGQEKLLELIKTTKKERPIDPHTIPGVEGWLSSLIAGKVPTVEQHQAMTDSGFDAANAKIKELTPPHKMADINNLISQSADQWLSAGGNFTMTPVPNTPTGWNGHANGIITNPDPKAGGIIDKNQALGWFVIPNNDALSETFKDLYFATKEQALSDLAEQVAIQARKPIKNDRTQNKTNDSEWEFDLKNEGMSGAATLMVEGDNGFTHYVGYIEGEGYEVSKFDAEGNPDMDSAVHTFDPQEAFNAINAAVPADKRMAPEMFSKLNGDKVVAHKKSDELNLSQEFIDSVDSHFGGQQEPKEGDTKVEDGKTYVLYGGRWHLEGAKSLDVSGDEKKIADFKTGSYYQKEAYKKLSASDGWADVAAADKLSALQELYSQLQGAASHSAAVSLWKKAAFEGKNPTLAQWKAYLSLEEPKQKELFNLVEKKVGKTDHLKPLVSNDAPPELVKPTGPSAAEVLLAQKKKQETPKIVNTKPLTVVVEKHSYENTKEGHNKFWSVHVVGNKMTTTYGKIGTKGTSTTKEFASESAANVAMGKIIAEKQGKGYKYVGTEGIDVNLEFSAPDSPKEGDTKQGADGMLVFHDGRWHLQEKPLSPAEKKSAALTAALEAIKIPDFMALDKHVNAKNYPPLAQSIMAATVLNGAAGFKTYVTAYEGGMFASKPGAAGFKTNKCSPDKGTPRQKAFAQFCAQIKAVLDAHKGVKPKLEGTPSPAAKFSQPAPSVPTTAKAIKLPGIKVGTITAPDIKGWEQTGPQKGSNTGGQYKDKNGQQWYCKFPTDPDVVKNEFIAAKFYQMLGVAVPNLKLISKDGKLGIASKWVDGLSVVDAAKLAKAKGVHDAFAIDAWLANWDVVGLGNDNLMMGKDGAVHVDVGGSLLYRAQGGAKGEAFGPTVPELDTLLDKKLNPKTAAVFGKVTEDSMQFGLQQLNKIKPSQIEELCEKVGPGTAKEQKELAKTLIARRAFILKKYGIRDQWNEKPVDESKLSVNPADLPKAIDFVNYKGAGQGLSGSKHVNENNTKDSEAMIAFALKGNLTALKEYKYDAVDKETGKFLGKIPITDHPAKLIKEQWSGLVELLQSIAHPPKETLPLPSVGSAGSVEEISDMVGSFNPSERVETVAAEHRMGFFMKLGQIDDVTDLLEGYKWHFLTKQSGWVKECYNNFSKLSSAVRAYVGAVQASGWINHVFSQGKKTVSASGNGGKFEGGVQTLAAKVYKDAVEIPEGVVLYRGMSDTTAGKSMTQQFLNAKPGLIIQNTDSMCSSYNENHSWGGGVQLKIRCAKGAKGIPSFASGNYGSEHEITTLPGQRFVVLGVEKSGSGAKVDVLMLPPHDGYVAELGKLEALGKALMTIFRGK